MPKRGVGTLALAFVCALSGCSYAGVASSPQATNSASTVAAAPAETIVIAFDGGIAHEGSMKEMKAEKGADFVVPKCAFICDGYSFLYWVDEKGATWEPGDTLVASENKTLTAHWEADKSNGSIATSTVTTTAPANNSAPASNPASTFPRRWSGTYVGTSSYVQTSDHHITRSVAFDITSMSDGGHFEGTCYVGTYDKGPGETYGTCTISGDVDWATGEVHMKGTRWIDQGGLGDLREYSGYVNFSTWSMEGTAWDVGTGLYETPWNVSAVSTISIMQNGNMKTIP